MPDGQALEIVVDTAGESTEETDVLELIRDSWRKVGIALYTRPSQREVFRKRVFSGQSIMSVWPGLNNGIPTADMSPEELAPTKQEQLQWPMWGNHVESKGKGGEAPTLPEVTELLSLYHAWQRSQDSAERERIWRRMLTIHAEQQFTIGTVTGNLQPVVVHDGLRNVPTKGLYNWDPGAYFGIYRPDTFWIDEKRVRRSSDEKGVRCSDEKGVRKSRWMIKRRRCTFFIGKFRRAPRGGPSAPAGNGTETTSIVRMR